MQDRFKFRAYVKANEEVETVDAINFIENCTEWGEPEIVVDGVGRTFDEVIIMQCTGLKDKNGKLIYEGDIVNQIYEDETIYKCEVIYNNCSFQLKHIEDKNVNYINTPMYCYAINYLGHYTEKRLEVIGNIYENAELLEE